MDLVNSVVILFLLLGIYCCFIAWLVYLIVVLVMVVGCVTWLGLSYVWCCY